MYLIVCFWWGNTICDVSCGLWCCDNLLFAWFRETCVLDGFLVFCINLMWCDVIKWNPFESFSFKWLERHRDRGVDGSLLVSWLCNSFHWISFYALINTRLTALKGFVRRTNHQQVLTIDYLCFVVFHALVSSNARSKLYARLSICIVVIPCFPVCRVLFVVLTCHRIAITTNYNLVWFLVRVLCLHIRRIHL